MPLAVGNRASATGFSGTTITIASFTVTESSPLMLAVLISNNVNQFVSATWNGSEAFTLIDSQNSGGTVAGTVLLGLKNPTPGTFDIVITFTTVSSNGVACCAIGTTGGDTATGWRSSFKRSDGTGTGPGLTVSNAVNGDIVFHGAVVFGATIVFDAGETTTSTEFDNLAGSGISMGFSTKPATGSTPVGCDDVALYSEVAVAVMATVVPGVPFFTTIGAQPL